MSKLAEIIDVTECSTVDMVLDKTGTAWEPATMKLSAVMDKGGVPQSVKSGGFHAIVRPDSLQVLGICTGRYRPNSHVSHLRKLDGMVRQGALLPERVSVWDHGTLMAFQFRVPVLDANIMDGDRVSPLLTLAFFNDGKHGDMSFFADFRWFCKNQMGIVSKANRGNGRAAHRGDIHTVYETILADRIEEMKTVSATRYETMRSMTVRKLAKTPLLHYWATTMAFPDPSKPVEELLEWKLGEDMSAEAKTLRAILGAWRDDDTHAPGTVWHAYNAVTRYLTHNKGRNTASRSRNALFGMQGTGHVMDVAFEEAAKLAA